MLRPSTMSVSTVPDSLRTGRIDTSRRIRSSVVRLSAVNYPTYRSPDGSRLRVGLPVSTTRCADTGVSTGSAVSTGVDESLSDSFANQKSSISGDVDSERPAPISLRPRERMFHAAFASLSASNPHEGHECSRTHKGFSVETPQDAHSFVVPRGFTATKCVPSRSHLYSSIRRNVPHAAPARFRELPGSSTNPFASKSSTATSSYSVA